LAKNGLLWGDGEGIDNPKECTSLATSDFLSEVVQDLKNRREFELAGEVQRLLGRIRN
jgi:hypothetical protein